MTDRYNSTQLAEAGYQAYADFTGGKTFDGRDMPAWEDLPDRTVQAWRAAAVAITRAVLAAPAPQTQPVPTIGRIVHYTLSEQDADAINRRRAHARAHTHEHMENSNGVIVHTGNDVAAGDVYPLIITRVWGSEPDSAVNGQVLLDGNDLFWATSVSCGEGERHFTWPTRV